MILSITLPFRFKASETLLGIETAYEIQERDRWVPSLQSLWNPFRDWNLLAYLEKYAPHPSFKASETLLGIETSPT